MRGSKPTAYAPELTPDRQQALLHLFEASQAALELGDSPSAFACQLTSLHALGVTDTILRWLVAKGFAEHCFETTKPRQVKRTFRAAANLCFTPVSCFVLTPAGTALAEGLTPSDQLRLDPVHKNGNGHRPHYDVDRRMLLFGGQLVKQFKLPAENQELILLAFEEENWPPHLADPLPGKKEMDAKRRLNDAIKNLNANQIKSLVRFHGDGTGTGVLWKKLP